MSDAGFESFRKAVENYFKGRGETITWSPDFGIAVGPSGAQMGMGNLMQMCAKAEPATWGTVISEHFGKLEAAQGQRLPSFYSPDLINADISLDGLVEGLRKHAEARLCFYGPPGTGKTAFGCWLAQELDRPLMVQRVSDLVSPYVGQTELNLAKAFEKASQDGAVQQTEPDNERF